MMAYQNNKKARTLHEHWNSLHVTIFLSSLFFATVIFFIFLFFSGSTPPMSFARKILIHVGAYFTFFILGQLMHYLFFYLPNYIFYKRMIKDGKEDEVKNMIHEYGLEKLIRKNWFIYKEKSGLLIRKENTRE